MPAPFGFGVGDFIAIIGLIAKVKPTPVIGAWKPPIATIPPDRRRELLPPESIWSDRVRTDWDTMSLERDPVDDLYHCPFTKCP